jgi:hypothetical protein
MHGRFSNHITISNSMKILRVRAEFYVDRRTDGRTEDRHETNSRFSQFCEKRLKKEELYLNIESLPRSKQTPSQL